MVRRLRKVRKPRARAMALRRAQIVFPSRGAAQAGLGGGEGSKQEGVLVAAALTRDLCVPVRKRAGARDPSLRSG